jgi:hypothetical protein
LRIALASDLHTLHREVEIPRADLLIVAGDACFMGNGPRQLDDLNDWLGELPVRNRVITAGNHDTRIAADVQMWRKRLSNATLLINEVVIIEGVHIWGSPVSRVDGAFGMPDEAERDALYSEIPSDPRLTSSSPTALLLEFWTVAKAAPHSARQSSDCVPACTSSAMFTAPTDSDPPGRPCSSMPLCSTGAALRRIPRFC